MPDLTAQTTYINVRNCTRAKDFKNICSIRCAKELACLPLGRVCGSGPSPLPKLDIAKNGVSISGLSSGADFVVQFQVAFSEVVNGLGVFAGQPYHCAVHMFEGDKLVNKCIYP